MEKKTAPVSLIIVNWNSGEWLSRCLQAVFSQSCLPEKIILIDNDSSDDSLQEVRALIEHPLVCFIQSGENLGFAKANNLAINQGVSTDWTVLLNPDAIPEPDWLEQMWTAVKENPQYSFFASKMVDALNPTLMDGAGDSLHFSGLGYRQEHGLPAALAPEPNVECFSACAGAAMYQTSILKQASGFDEDFFCYFEDVDLGFRLRLQGHKCLYVPAAIVAHVGSVTSGGKQSDFSIYHGHRNLVWTYVKNMPAWLFVLCLPAHLLMNIVVVIVYGLRGRGKVVLRAKKDAIRGLPRMWGKRKKIQKQRRVGCALIWQQLDKKLFFTKK